MYFINITERSIYIMSIMTRSEFILKYTDGLNEQQMEAVQTIKGPVLLLAVPGSGKTTVLVHRLAYMIFCEDISPEQILTLTYTVAATKDMKERFGKIFGEEYAKLLEFRTINGICAKIIQEYGEKIGKQAFSLITDENSTGRVLAEILRNNLSEFPTESDIRNAKTLITYCKNMMLDQKEISALGEKEGIPLFSIYEEYNSYLRKNSLMDYDDQMVYAFRMLKNDPALLEQYRRRYVYICVDEAQDTSRIQHEIIGLLAGKNGNLFMVGDEDQSIYGFRAAYPQSLLEFEHNHKNAKVLVMHYNYRCNGNIVDAADRLIQRNRYRHQKQMRAVKRIGDEISYPRLQSRAGQYDYLLKIAQSCDCQTAVLYRDHESILPLIDRLERKGVPYRMKGTDMSFFTHRVVTDITNILLFAMNPYDTELFMQIFYKCKTYLKRDQAELLCSISIQKNIPVLDGVEYMEDIHGMVKGNCKSLRTNLLKMRKEDPGKALFRIQNPIGYGEYMERNSLDFNKFFVLKMLATKENSIGSFLERLSVLRQMLRQREENRECNFILSTIHSSKGLEYERVFLIDVCDGVFPGREALAAERLSGKNSKELEEERRLFYVGITRAKEKLYIFQMERESSRFLKEMKEKEAGRQIQVKVKKNVIGSASKKGNKAEGSKGCWHEK